MWSPTLEWSVDNPSISGNAFDVLATVTFVHTASGETRKTEMFYDGGTTWLFRFTATRTGAWTFSSSSTDPDLDGWTGSISVSPNPDPTSKGFIVASGTRFARQVSDASGDGTGLEGYLHNVFQDEVDLRTSAIWGQGLGRWADPSLTHALIDQIEDNGFDTMEVELEHQVFQLNAARHTDHNRQEPDLDTFRIVEQILTIAHARGHTVRLFMWGDESRRMTPEGLPGGINGSVDQRMQRYLCARLGPLPGWTMNYGFDLEEWVSESEVGVWASYMNDHMGWPHLLAARRRSHPQVDLDANDKMPTDGFYDLAVEKIGDSGGRPVVFDYRFIYLRDGDWTMETTIRALWQLTMAGGAGAVWGRDEEEYPGKAQLRTHFAFWHTASRFQLDLVPDSGLSNGWALRTPGFERVVAYMENTSSIDLDLSEATEPLAAIAVDTRIAFSEVDLGLLSPGSHSITLPYNSDWAVAAEAPASVSVPTLSITMIVWVWASLIGLALAIWRMNRSGLPPSFADSLPGSPYRT